MPPAGDYLLTHVGFSQEKPLLSLQKSGEYRDFFPLGNQFSLTFTTTQRFCVGWRDITTGERFVCPEHASVDMRYEQCATCQQRTGFNPAFYHAATVSSQQQARNAEPHLLYLAHFGDEIVKVGISHAARGHGRLIEQGARSAIILDTFPSAVIARQYEAKIAKLAGVAETLQVRQKIALLKRPYQPAQGSRVLREMKERIEAEIGTSFSGQSIEQFDHVYFPDGTPLLHSVYDLTSKGSIAGQAKGMVGSLLVCQQQEEYLLFAMKKRVGYMLALSYDAPPIPLPHRQLALL